LQIFLPEAVGQALALAKLTSEKSVRFCLSNGTSWIFAVVIDNGTLAYHESTIRRLESSTMKERGEAALDRVQQLLVLIREWLNPTDANGLYKLID